MKSGVVEPFGAARAPCADLHASESQPAPKQPKPQTSFQTQPWKRNSASAVDKDPSGWTLGQPTGKRSPG